jgi:hypothetical protein
MTDAATPTRQIATVRTYDGLRKALSDYCARAEITRAKLDVEAGLADGHAAKLLAPAAGRRLGRAVRHFGIVSLGRVLDALGLELIVQVRADAVRDLAAADASADASDAPHPKDWRRRRGTGWAQRMNGRRALLLPPARRSEIAREAAQAR